MAFKKAKLNKSGTLSLLTVGRPSDATTVVTISSEDYNKLKAGKRVKFSGSVATKFASQSY